MFGGAKIKIEKELYEKLKKFADISGYSSVDEFVVHVLEREVSKMGDDAASDEEIRKKLEGLGYIS